MIKFIIIFTIVIFILFMLVLIWSLYAIQKNEEYIEYTRRENSDDSTVEET